MDMKATLVSESETLAELNGKQVFITQVVDKAGPDIDEESLPMFKVVGLGGEKLTLYPEELRTGDLADVASELEDPLVYVGGNPVTNLHPVVRETLINLSI